MTDRAAARAQLIDHLRRRAIRTDGPFTLRSGAVSSWYIDARQTTFDGNGARLLGEVVAAELEPEVAAVGGLTMGADPIAVATAIAAAGHGRDIRAFSIRKESKDHGTGGRLVGPVTSGDTVAIVDDTVTTGGALVEAIEVAQAHGLHVCQVLALVDRSGGEVERLVAASGHRFRSVVDVTELGVGE
ncbi:MAG: orotate phosphoribosyltransferase [Acidimicrobiia bacterium]|nr:orotate phosphoribosyltransferase [Acidimicrobiia bacterium]